MKVTAVILQLVLNRMQFINFFFYHFRRYELHLKAILIDAIETVEIQRQRETVYFMFLKTFIYFILFIYFSLPE